MCYEVTPMRIAWVVLAPLALLVSTGCGGDGGDAESAVPRAAAATAPRACEAGRYRRLGSARRAFAAVVRSRAVAYRRPGVGRLASFGRLNVNGVPTVLGVRGEVVGADCDPRWYHVQLPIRPNGITGYVRARDVDVATVRTRIVVDLSERRLTVFEDGRAVLEAGASVGSPATPTPVGEFYVNQRLVPEVKTGPYGPGAVGVSAFSNVLTGWTQGGPIAIHGTNRPDLIGEAVSNGCIRVRNDVLLRLFPATLAGTPVIIRP